MTTTDPYHPRGRETGDALSEIRTVLGRAEAAITRLKQPHEHHRIEAHMNDLDEFVPAVTTIDRDPEADEMIGVLEAFIAAA